MSSDPEKIDELVAELLAVDPAQGYPDGYDGAVLGAIHQIYEVDGEIYTDGECLALMHRLINHWSEVVDL